MTEPNKFTIKPEGPMTFKKGADGMEVSSAKPLSFDLGHIKAVGIHNLVDVVEHSISEQVGFVSHLVKFRDGASVEYAFNAKGEIITLRGVNVLTTIQNGNEVMFKMHPPGSRPAEPTPAADNPS